MSQSEQQVEAGPVLTLAETIVERIRREGKISLSDWMSTALYHPTLGYYNRPDLQRWGREGDYRTSPERSELFSATFARYFADLYTRLGRPQEFTILEMGSGNGRFAAGALDALQTHSPALFGMLRYVLVDTSNNANERAALELQRFSDCVRFTTIADLEPINSGVIFSNELLDAFPVHRIIRLGNQLKELYVCLDRDGKFVWLADEPSSPEVTEFCELQVPEISEGQMLEVNLAIDGWLELMEQKLETGYLITVDYGAQSRDLYESPERHQGTLRAIRHHQFVDDFLQAPGDCDVTSSVNWTYVMAKARSFVVDEFMALDKFLMKAGVLDELELRLVAARNEAERSALTTAAREMILPGGMAASFQVLVQKR